MEPEQIVLNRQMEVASDVARAAGRLLMSSLGTAIVQEKGPRDLVTQIDIQSQELISRGLGSEFPDVPMVGEEDREYADWTRGEVWVVDPLDGTTNYSHGLPGFSVSIALCRDGQPVLGVVFDPWLDELFTASLVHAATLNEMPIRPSACRQLEKALLVSSFPSTVAARCPELVRFNRVVQFATTRRLGSAALNFCYVASGRLDGYWASTLKIWDAAAGAFIARQAGATCRHLTGGEVDWRDPQIVATGTVELSAALIPMLQIGSEVERESL